MRHEPKIVQIAIGAKSKLLFTPLPQLHMLNILQDHEICDPSDITILEYTIDEDLSKIFFDISALDPDIVTFSCYLWTFKAVEQISFSLKSLYGDKCWVIWGGPHVSEDPLRFVKRHSDSVDMLVAWYGERPIIDIIKAWKDFGGNIEDAKNYLVDSRISSIYFSGNFQNLLLEENEKKSIVKTQRKINSNAENEIERYNQFNGDTFGIRAGNFIPFADLPQAYQINRMPNSITDVISERIFSLESYRGCPFACSYCLWGVAQKKCDYHDADRMTREFQDLVSWGARQFNFADAGFGLKGARDMKFLRSALDIASQLKNNDKMNISGYFFWQTLTPEMLDVIEELVGKGVMGQMDIGIQTFSREVTKIMKRPTDFAKFDKTIREIQKRKISFQMDLILGLPGDNFDGYLDSVKKIISYEPNKFQTFPLTILPGSDYDKRREELGIKTLRGSRTMDIDTIVETKSFPRSEIKKALRVESFFYLTYTLRLLNRTFRKIEEVTDTLFFDVSLELYNWSCDNEKLIFGLCSQYYNSLYEDRHAGRRHLDNFLFKNYNGIHDELRQFIDFYLESHNAGGHINDVYEFLAFDLLIFPKKFETLESSASFNHFIQQKYPHTNSILVKFSCPEILDHLTLKNKVRTTLKRKKGQYLMLFKEPECNFREGGISTQYNFWKWEVEMADTHLKSD